MTEIFSSKTQGFFKKTELSLSFGAFACGYVKRPNAKDDWDFC
ncbi:hypothetical protein [Helicobacter pylori]|nr:hypothetical protein [Helicobacter pylori]